MLDVDMAADTELGAQAISHVESYVRENAQDQYEKEEKWPVSRSQIAGLRQIGNNEPGTIGKFAEHQRKRAQAKLDSTSKDENKIEIQKEIDFWNLVKGVYSGSPPNKFPWSLQKLRDQAVPAELTEEKLASGAKLSKQQQAARKEKKQQRDAWMQQWQRTYVPAFFQRFCAHYLYEMSKRTRET